MKLTVTNLGKQYNRDFWALKDFSLKIKPAILSDAGGLLVGMRAYTRLSEK